MSRTRHAPRARMMRSMHTARHPLVLRRGMRVGGYGYSEQTGFPQMTVGAMDETTGGAVTWVAEKLLVWDTALPAPGELTGDDTSAINNARERGVFTEGLKTAVIKYQTAMGLKKKDGIVGPETYKSLGYTGKVDAPTPPRAPAGAGGGKKPVDNAPPSGPEESITDKAWFWPVAILVPTAAVIGGILFWPKKKAQS